MFDPIAYQQFKNQMVINQFAGEWMFDDETDYTFPRKCLECGKFLDDPEYDYCEECLREIHGI